MDSVRTFIQIGMNWNPAYSYSELPKEFNADSIPIHWKKLLKKVEPASKGIPTFRNITINNVNVKGAEIAINVNGLENSIINNVTLSNIQINSKTAGQISYTSNWVLNNVKIITEDASKVALKSTTNVVIPEKVYTINK